MVYVVIGIAGAVGALLRYYLGLSVGVWWRGYFPLATLIVNCAGCLCLGWFIIRVRTKFKLPDWVQTGVVTGLIGSFTTFSAFSVETMTLLRDGRWSMALLYVLLSFWGGLLFFSYGYKLGEMKGRDQRS